MPRKADTSSMVRLSGVETSSGPAAMRGGPDALDGRVLIDVVRACPGHRPGQFHVSGVAAGGAHRHPVLSGGRWSHVLVGLSPAHEPAVALHPVELQPAAAEYAVVRIDMLGVALLQTRVVEVEGIGVLHEELAHAQHAAFGPRLVPELELQLVPRLGKVPVGAQLP